ncbi:MAG: MGMT family protein [Candidatus Parcubacteria bacterium]|nr:MGMT family protein [Candidatus Parcubacteria bacterium]
MTIFENQVLSLVKKIPKGKVSTYQLLAIRLGDKALARAVGNALSKNPRLIKVPCHRVIKSNGALGGYARGLAKKLQLLQNEGIRIERGKVANLAKCLYHF